MLDSLEIRHELEGGDVITKHDGLREAQSVAQDSFRMADKPNGRDVSVAERVARRLIGTKQTKLASVDSDSFHHITEQVRQFTDRDLPVPLTTAAGAMKDKAETLDAQRPDVVELMALSTLHGMQSAVSAVYSPGIKVQLIEEDTGDKYLNNSNETIAGFVDTYSSRFEQLIASIPATRAFILPVRESALLTKSGINSTLDFGREAEPYREAFLDYLVDTDNLVESEWENTPSFERLQEFGWLGVIPQEMREFYYDRAALIYETDNYQRHVDNLARFFAAVLLRKKSGVTSDASQFGEEYEGVDAQPIRFSYATPTPGMPTRGGRIFLRAMPRKICSKGIPYWCADGVMVERQATGGKHLPGIRGRHDPLFEGMERVPGIMTVQGAGKAQVLDADLLKADTMVNGPKKSKSYEPKQ